MILVIHSYSNNSQIDSPAMGSPLGLIVAYIFLFHHEENLLKGFTVEFKLVFYKMVFYRRYVDDSSVLFALSESTHSFGECKVFKLQNIDFNVEHEKHDLLLVLYNNYRENNKIVFSVYRKATFKRVLTNYESFIPTYQKRVLL